MHVAVDTFPLLATMAGAERFTGNLLRNIARLDSANHYTLFLSTRNRERFEIKQENFNNLVWRVPINPRLLRVLSQQVLIPLSLHSRVVDLFYGACNIVPVFVNCPVVVSVHDLVWFRLGYLFSAAKLLYLRVAIGASLRRAALITTLSESSARDICRLFGVPREKIRIIPPGVDTAFVAGDREAARKLVASRYRVERPFILHVGETLRRKNLVRLLEAYALLRDKRRLGHALVLVGREGDGYAEVVRTVDRLHLNHDVALSGAVACDEDLVAFYRAADLLVYPSLHEGFGIPLIEAFACGTPVVASAASSLPEVAGDAAVLVDPLDSEAIADGIWTVLSDRELRLELTVRGLKRAGHYSWEQSARALLKAFAEVAGRP